jgi:dipeptidyl aminopeptidase/acylaminoacyl peptidase
MSADGSDQRNLTHTPEAEEYAAAWAPDGRTIAFAAYDGQSNRIFVINADGSRKRALTHKITETFMSWSPDARKIAFFDGAISVVNADGSGLRRLARNVAFHGPSWSPDGRKLIFVRLRHPKKIWPATGTPPPPSPSPAARPLGDERRRERAAEPHPHPNDERRLGGHLGALEKQLEKPELQQSSCTRFPSESATNAILSPGSSARLQRLDRTQDPAQPPTCPNVTRARTGSVRSSDVAADWTSVLSLGSSQG